MRASNIRINQNLCECRLPATKFCGELGSGSLDSLESLKIANLYPRGSLLFVEGQQPQGVYILCDGRVKLSTCSRDGKVIILQIAEPGEILGLSAAVSDSPYEATAEVLEPCQVGFVRKSDFLAFLQSNSDACLSAVRQLSQNYQTAHLQICSLGLSNSVADKLARLFLGWCDSHTETAFADRSVRLKNSYTHEEIAEMIGTSRETVSRLLKTFKERKLISLKGADLIIHDRRRLESLVSQ